MSLPQSEPDTARRFLLDFLVAKHPTLFSVDELVREYAGGDDQETARLEVEEGVRGLAGNGLVHRLDEYVFATRAAVCAKRLAA